MTDLRARFERLDDVAVPNLWGEIERRAERMAGTPQAVGLRPRIRWGAGPLDELHPIGGRRFAPLPVLLLLALLIIAMLAAATIGGGWGWWNRPGVLVPPSTEPAVALLPDGDCPGAVTIADDPLPFHGWNVGPLPGWFATAHPGRITGLWHERQPQPPGFFDPPMTNLVFVELDPVARTMCRLITAARSEQAALLEGATLPDVGWTSHGDALAYFHGDVEGPGQCCAPGQLTVWTPGAYADPPVFLDTDFGSLDWSNRGDVLAVGSGNGTHSWADPQPAGISLYTAGGIGPRELRFDCTLCIVFGAHFSPDDSRIAVTYWRVTSDDSADKLIGVADASTGEGAVLDVGLAKLSIVRWADDHTILALDNGRRLIAVPVDRPSEFRVVANLPLELGSGVFNETWSPDLSRVAYRVWNTERPDGGAILSTDIFVFDVASGLTRQVFREAGADVTDLVWAPDNRTFAYLRRNEDLEHSVTLKVADALVNEPIAIALGVSPVGWRPVWR